MSGPVRLGVIGLGSFGRRHARICATLPEVELVGAADPAVSAIAELPTLTVVRSCAELLALGLDAAIVATPPDHNLALAERLADAGVHTLIEKPLAPSVEAATRIHARFEAAQGAVAGVAHVERFNPAVRALVAALASVAPLRAIEVVRRGPAPVRSWALSVGLDLAIHDLDLLAWIGGGLGALRPTSVSAELVRASGELADGTPFTLVADRRARERVRRIEVVGARGRLRADLLTRELAASYGAQPGPLRAKPAPGPEPLRRELEGFCAAIRGLPEAELVPLAAGVEAVRFAAQLSPE